MNRNLVFVLAGIAVVALVTFAVVHSSHKPAQQTASAPEAGAPTPAAAAPAPDVPFMEQQEAKQLLDRNAVAILDVRDIDAYTASHVPGAMQIPLARVEGEIPYLPKDKPLVAYCTCPHDEAAIEAVQIMQHGGMTNARVLRGGLQEWTRLGFPTASGMK
jgi:rhodanese-related sulfurtransferase